MKKIYEKAVELLVSDIQDKVLKEKIGTLGKKTEMEINEPPKNIILYPSEHFNDGLIETSIPLTRRERRKLNLKKNRYEKV